MTADYTIDVVRTIRRNAGTVPPQKLADTLGWSIAQLERVAAKHHIDLRMLAVRIVEDAPPRTPTFPSRTMPASERHSEQFGPRLRVADAKILRAKAAARFVEPGVLARQIIEGAIARGKVDELASAAKSYRPVESGEGET